jgi:hypothetical protein
MRRLSSGIGQLISASPCSLVTIDSPAFHFLTPRSGKYYKKQCRHLEEGYLLFRFWKYSIGRKRVEPDKTAIAELTPHECQIPSMKLAVFQVCEPGKRANLLCLEMRSLQSAAELEHWLRMNVGAKTDVTLLGRFDCVCFSSNESEIESLVLGDIKGRRPVVQHL